MRTEAGVNRIGALPVAVLGLLLAGCGTVHAGAGTAGPPVSASPSPARWKTYGPYDDQLVNPSAGSSGLVLTVGVQMPTGRYGCERDLTGKVKKFDRTYAFVSITYQSRLWPDARACTWRVVTVRVGLPAPLGHRNVYFNGDTVFLASHGKLKLQCQALNGAGCGIAATPVPASCTGPSFQQAMGETAPAMDAGYGMLGCDRRWLALTVGWPGGAAGCDGPSCSPDVTSTYWFFRAGPQGWEIITASRTAGCARVHEADPQFPARLCAALPALPG
jgi:hypothetical protein